MDHNHNEDENANQDENANPEEEVIDLSSDDDESYYEMESIEEVRMEKGRLEYQITWMETDVITWEPEESFIGEESMRVLARFREDNREKIERLIQEDQEKRERRRKQRAERSRSREEGQLSMENVAASSSNTSSNIDDSGFSARELTEDDSFYGKPVKELQGESKRLFDPNHMQTPTDLLLATYVDSDGRMSRSKAAKLKQEISGSASGSERSETPTVPKKASGGRGRGRGRGKGANVTAPMPEKTPSPSFDMANVESVEKEEDEEEDGEPTVKKKRQRKSAPKSTPSKRGRGGGRGRGRGRKLPVSDLYDAEISDDDDDEDNNKPDEIEPEPVETEAPPKPRANRKRLAKEPSPLVFNDDRRSETPEVIKPKFFIGRNDMEDIKLPGPTKIVPNSSDPVAEVANLFKSLQSSKKIENNEGIVEAILSGDLLTARLIFNRMSGAEIDSVVSRWKGSDGRPILHVLINRMKPGPPGKASNDMTMMRLVLSFTRQFIFFISDAQGNMAIHEAVRMRNFQVVRLLANSSSLMVQRNNNGETPLMLAMMNRDLKIFQFLLNRGVTYHQLLSREDSREKTLLKEAPNFAEVLNKTVQQQNKELSRMRKRFLKANIKDLQPASPILITPRHESNELNFTFECLGKLDHANQGHLLMMFPIVYHNTLRKWVACLNNIPVEKDQPLLNGLAVSKVQNKTHSSVYLCVPKNGINQLVIPLLNDSWNSCAAVAVQIIKYEKSNGQGPSSQIPPPLPQHQHYRAPQTNVNLNQGPTSNPIHPHPHQRNPHHRPHPRR